MIQLVFKYTKKNTKNIIKESKNFTSKFDDFEVKFFELFPKQYAYMAIIYKSLSFNF